MLLDRVLDAGRFRAAGFAEEPVVFLGGIKKIVKEQAEFIESIS